MMTDAMIQRSCANRRPVILDLAASDGTTSLDLIEKLGKGFARYYVTDVSFIASCIEDDGRFYFFDRHGECTLVAGRHYLVFSGVNGAIFPFGLIARRILASAPRHNDQRVRKVSLLNPDLRDRAAADPRIVIQEHDMFAPWTGETPEIIKIANVLNRDYFSDAQLSNVLGNLKKTLAAGGRLFVTDNNRDKERVSVFVKVGARMELLEQVNGGAQVTELALAV